MTADPRIEQIRAVLDAHYDPKANTGTEVNVVARITRILDREPVPDSETQWGYRFGDSATVDCVGTERRARSEALRAIEMTGSRVALVRREVGPWTEVQP